MKIVLIYRKSRPGGYSIEELFRTIAGEMRKYAEVIEYECGSRWALFTDLWRLWAMHADVYHITGDINWLGLLLPRANTVLTVHDIGHYLFGLTGIKRRIYKVLWLSWPMRAVRAVNAVSAATRENIVSRLGMPEHRIHLIENCHSAVFRPAPLQFNESCPRILQVGTKPYKNVPRLIEALHGIPCRLVLIGHLDKALISQLREHGVDYENYVDLSHDDIYQQYRQCDIVSFVSLGEGFGVPIIEAQAVGRPLITANLSPMREVAGAGACLVDPLDPTEIRNGIQKIIADADYRNRLIQEGFKNVARYTPAAIAAQYYDLYKKVIGR